MHIAVLQTEGRGTDIDANLRLLADTARAAATRGASVLVTPEMFLSGYNIPTDALRACAQRRDGEALERISGIARQYALSLVVGYPERDGSLIYNSALLVDALGRQRINHRKSHLFGDVDRRVFHPGDGAVELCALEGFSVGLLICYDVEFPETVRALALAGADLVIVPTALMHPYAFVPRHMIPTRAYENQLFMVYANRCGREEDLIYQGLSCIVGPDGEDLARAGDGEALVAARVERDALAPSRALNSFLADRRPRLYRSLVAREND
jgi:predicted amidohydrolase